MNLDIWVVSILSQQFVKGCYCQNSNFQNDKIVSGKTPLLVKDSFCTPHFVCLNIDF